MKSGCTMTFFLTFFLHDILQAQPFEQRRQQQFSFGKKPYYYIDINYRDGGLLANDIKWEDRIRKELDFLKSNGIMNLQLMAGAAGKGQINGVPKVEPALQTKGGVFKTDQLKKLDFLLAEMGKSFDKIGKKTTDYITKYAAIAKQINKALVVEEFGLAENGHSFLLSPSTSYGDRYYTSVFDADISTWKIVGSFIKKLSAL